MKIKQTTILIWTSAFLLTTSCGIPAGILTTVNSAPKDTQTFPLTYSNQFPDTLLEKWDKDYEAYNHFLTPQIRRTQLGLSFEREGVYTWWCGPSALTHAQLDTNMRITDSTVLFGNWRATCTRNVLFTDSFVYGTGRFYRTSTLLNIPQPDDVVLTMTPYKFILYAKDHSTATFKRKLLKNYRIESKRYLLLYGISPANAAVSFIGTDKEGRLIVNNHYVKERKKPGQYIVYESIMTQYIFKKLPVVSPAK